MYLASTVMLFYGSIPPFNEQHRILTKLDELILQCDQLKVRITEANQLQQKLADAIVEKVVT